MKVITCMDDHMGMCFNGRRVSRDRVVTEDVLNLTKDGRLWIAPESETLFADYQELKELENWKVDPDFLEKAGTEEYCFVEKSSVKEYESEITGIVLYRWNRSYPADLFFDIDLDRWDLKEKVEFCGHSHEKITREIYSRQG